MIDLDPELSVRTALNHRSSDDRCADVCPTCGLHMIKTVTLRLRWLVEGGEAKCEFCRTTKTRTVG